MSATTVPSNRRYANVLSDKLTEDARDLAFEMSRHSSRSPEYDELTKQWARMSAELVLRWAGFVETPRNRTEVRQRRRDEW